MKIGDILNVAFPTGTQPELLLNGKVYEQTIDLSMAPLVPADLFGICAIILERSGIYHTLMPGCRSLDKSPFAWFIPDSEMKIAREAGEKWANFTQDKSISDENELDIFTPDVVTKWWKLLYTARDQALFEFQNIESDSVPEWWKAIFLMMIAADEACLGIGLYSKQENATCKISKWDAFAKINATNDLKRSIEASADDLTIEHRPTFNNLALKLNPDIAMVRPKTRTANVGCTLRTLTHNLALGAPRGQIGSYWIRSQSESFQNAESTGFNILMIPFPYSMSPDWFEAYDTSNGPHLNERGDEWNWFDIHQKWLPTHEAGILKFIRFIDALIREASGKKIVHCVVFPELSLNWKIYKRLSEHIKVNWPTIEVLVSGSTDNCMGHTGNYVINSMFYPVMKDGLKVRTQLITSRAKHHRWRLDKEQINTYGLQKVLDPKMLWWEHIPIAPREMHHVVFREGCTFTSLICEDLARSDPCHRNLRAIGPNLLFVLLMDGPQLPFRWSARYSTGMTDDPGTSVLTITSRALVERANTSRRKSLEKRIRALVNKGENADSLIDELNRIGWSVALFKDDKSSPTPIVCTPDNQAVLLELKVQKVEEVSFDGRRKMNALAWRRQGVQPLQIDISKNHKDLVSEFS